jgi:hypothetical protein
MVVLEEKVHPITLGLLEAFIMPPPVTPLFSEKVQLVTVGLLPLMLAMPPPPLALFLKKEHSVITGFALLLYTPPPWFEVELSVKIQWRTVGLPPLMNRPPP